MAKQSAPIQQVSRLLDLVPFLSTHSHISLKELAKEFGVTDKEIAAELTALSMCGLPGYTPYEPIEVFFDSGFVTINNHEALDIPRALTNLEVASLLIGLQILRDSMSDSEKSTAKIDGLIDQLHTLSGESIAVDPNPNSVLIAQAQRAIAGRKMLKIEYVDSVKREPTVRKINPLSIYVENSHTYLASFCTTAQGNRNFRFDRIVMMTEVEGLVEEVSASSTVDREFTASVKVSGRKRAIAEFLSAAAIPADGQFSYSAFSPRWLEKAAISFAPDLQITSPIETRAAIAREIEATLALYRS